MDAEHADTPAVEAADLVRERGLLPARRLSLAGRHVVAHHGVGRPIMPALDRNADQVIVPDVVGMTVTAARRLATRSGVALAQPDADGPPLGALTWPGVWTITEQQPAPGTTVFRWDSVVVRFASGDDGPSGVREPRRPRPGSSAAAAALRREPD